jgi:hypothetical protein
MRLIRKCPKCKCEMYYDAEHNAYCCNLCKICVPDNLSQKNIEKEKEDENSSI